MAYTLSVYLFIKYIGAYFYLYFINNYPIHIYLILLSSNNIICKLLCYNHLFPFIAAKVSTYFDFDFCYDLILALTLVIFFIIVCYQLFSVTIYLNKKHFHFSFYYAKSINLLFDRYCLLYVFGINNAFKLKNFLDLFIYFAKNINRNVCVCLYIIMKIYNDGYFSFDKFMNLYLNLYLTFSVHESQKYIMFVYCG